MFRGFCEIIHMRRQSPNPKSDAAFATRQFYKDVGSLIREARKKAKDISQESLATSVGLTRTSLTNIEKGRQKVLLHTFVEIAAAIGADPVDLLPKKSNVLNGLGVALPSSLPAEERGFIERAVGAGQPYETIQTKNHRDEGKITAGKQQRNGSPDRR